MKMLRILSSCLAFGIAACQFDDGGGPGLGSGGGPPASTPDASPMTPGPDAVGGTGGTGGMTGADASSDDGGTTTSGPTVGDVINSGCTTTVVLGLSLQIAEEIACTSPSAFSRFPDDGDIHFVGANVVPYLTTGAINDLEAAGANMEIDITTAFRTIAQELLVYRWYQTGRCSIPAAFAPGTSNHETGRAIDASNWSPIATTMSSYGWQRDVFGDDPHFDHTASPDLRGSDVSAFQRLWNRNHPSDLIAVDGDYGPMTEARLLMSPAGGFPIGACGHIGMSPEDASWLSTAWLRPELPETSRR